MKNKFLSNCIKIGLYLTCLILFTGCNKKGEEILLNESIKSQYDTYQVRSGDMIKVSSYPGVVAPAFVTYSLEEKVVVEEIRVSHGDYVNEGDVLALLSYSSSSAETKDNHQLSLLEIERNKDSTSSKLELLKEKLEEINSLVDIVSNNEIKQLEQEIKLQELILIELEQKAEHLKEWETHIRTVDKKELYPLGRLEIISNTNGMICYRIPYAQNEVIEPDTPLIIVTDEKELFIETSYISEDDFNRADKKYGKMQDKVIPLQLTPYSEAELSLLYSNQISPKGRFKVSELQDISSGDLAVVFLEEIIARNVIWVPPNGVFYDEHGAYVHIYQNKDTVAREVLLGRSTDTQVEVIAGLEEGEIIVIY